MIVSPVLRAALAYAEQGWPVFPLGQRKVPLPLCALCRTPGRCPGRDGCVCDVGTCHGFWAATTQAATIESWFGRHPSWQVGIRTGATSNLAVIDIDEEAGGLLSLDDLQATRGMLPHTLVQLSGRGTSVHLFYAHPGRHLGNSGSRLGPGLDVRGCWEGAPTM
jgi:hypothetical protein